MKSQPPAPAYRTTMACAPAAKLVDLPAGVIDKVAASLDAQGVGCLLSTNNRTVMHAILHPNSPALRNKLVANLQHKKMHPSDLSGELARSILKSLPCVALPITCPSHVEEVAMRNSCAEHFAEREARVEAMIDADPELRALRETSPIDAHIEATDRYILQPIHAARAEATGIWQDVKHLVEHTDGQLFGVFEHLWRNWALLSYVREDIVAGVPALTFDTLREEPALHALIERSPSIDFRMGANIPGLLGHTDTMEMLLTHHGDKVERLSLDISDLYKGMMPLFYREAVLTRLVRVLESMQGLRHLVLDQTDNIASPNHLDPGTLFLAHPAFFKQLQSFELSMIFPESAALRESFFACLVAHAPNLSKLTIHGAYLHPEIMPAMAQLSPRLRYLGLDHLAVPGMQAAAATSHTQHVHLSRPSRCHENELEVFIHERARLGLETTLGER